MSVGESSRTSEDIKLNLTYDFHLHSASVCR